jgi:hypothetical protein
MRIKLDADINTSAESIDPLFTPLLNAHESPFSTSPLALHAQHTLCFIVVPTSTIIAAHYRPVLLLSLSLLQNVGESNSG